MGLPPFLKMKIVILGSHHVLECQLELYSEVFVCFKQNLEHYPKVIYIYIYII
jgi:hypothetical protein